MRSKRPIAQNKNTANAVSVRKKPKPYVKKGTKQPLQMCKGSLMDELSNQVQHKERFSMNKSCGVW